MKAPNDVHGIIAISSILEVCCGDAVAIQAREEQYDYDALADAVHYLAERLVASNVVRGSRVGLIRADSAHWVVAFCALARLEATVVDVDPREDPGQTRQQLRETHVEFVLADEIGEILLDEVGFGEIPLVPADGYTLISVGDRICTSNPGVVHFAGDRTAGTSWAVATSWRELFVDARRLVVAGDFAERSTVYIAESMSAPHSWTLVLAAFMSGGSVLLIAEDRDQCSREPVAGPVPASIDCGVALPRSRAQPPRIVGSCSVH